jgi:FtsZ-interacting cell division protein ZipA
MSSALVPILVGVVVVVIALVVAGRWASRRQRTDDELAAPSTATIDYVVPDVQDPAVVVAALHAEGFTASTDPAQTRLVHVSCPAGPDRERAHVRSVIASVHTTVIDAGAPFDPEQVRFTDE